MARNSKPDLEDEYVLSAALEGLELQKQRIEQHIITIKGLLGRRGPKKLSSIESALESAKTTSKRQLSPAARRRIALAQKKRWAEYRAQKSGA